MILDFFFFFCLMFNLIVFTKSETISQVSFYFLRQTTDYLKNTFGDTFSVEIKPKQGWHSEKSTCAVDLCSRCLKQFAKLKQVTGIFVIINS